MANAAGTYRSSQEADAYGKLLEALRNTILSFTLMLLADIGSFVLFALVLRRRRPGYLAWGLWAYVLSTGASGYVLLERFDVCLSFLLMAWCYCWLRAPTTRLRGVGFGRSPLTPHSDRALASS